ncbi:MAG: DNA translocase FtsK 4TM domain-containing protein [Myxococcales bacterium]|nr:DNA translocase FtsK 4TM domain-containing protein [Myxococcales bacterium]
MAASKAEAIAGSTRKRGAGSKSKAETPRRRAADREADALRNEVLGIGVLAASLCLMLALASFHLEDVSATGLAAETGQTRNLIGPVGASMADVLLSIFGVAAFLLPVTLALPGICFVTGRPVRLAVSDAMGYPVLVLFCAMAGHLWMDGAAIMGHDAGGVIGAYGAEVLRALFGRTGAYILIYAVIALTFVLTTRVSIVRLAGKAATPLARSAQTARSGVASGAGSLVEQAGGRFGAWRAARAEAKDARRDARQAARTAKAEAKAKVKKGNEQPPDIEPEAPDEAPDESADVAPRAGGLRGLLGRLGGARRRPADRLSPTEMPLGRDEGFTLGAVDPDSVVDVEHVGAELEDPLDRAALAGQGDTMMAPALTDTPPPAARKRRAEPAPSVEHDAPDAPLDDVAGADIEEDEPAAEAAEPAAAAPEKPVVKQRRLRDEAEQLDIPLPEVQQYDGYVKPPLSFLDYDDSSQIEVDAVFLQDQAERLVEALKTFRIDGRVTEIHPGPVVTMFEFEPAPGVRISKIAGLADDLAMALKAIKVRIVAPIPGKGVVGFEVPNKQREMVYLKEVIGAPVFHNKKNQLPMALGKDIHGAPTLTDLAKMPHLLVAGTTGSGKSVGVNCMITSLLYHATPEDVRFIMVDPKMLELSIYEGVPHLLLPVVTDAKKAAAALKWAVDEMERRYELMKDAGVRDLRGHNRKLEKQRDELTARVEQLRLEAEAAQAAAEAAAVVDPETGAIRNPPEDDPRARRAREDFVEAAMELDELPRKIPYIVVVIDEFADLMMVAGKEVEYCVARIAQKARAAGIHLILATQRPSTDVITGVIKANFPTRIAFQVSSGIDSRTILSTNGAENLLGKGDMLFLPPGTSRLTRVHGAFVSEEEIHQVVDFIKAQQEPDYLDESVLDLGDEGGPDDDDDTGDMDPMYEEAVRVVFRDGRASTSHLQRRLSLGYNRAARIVDQMERDGLVGPSNGAKPRSVNKPVMTELIERWDSV